MLKTSKAAYFESLLSAGRHYARYKKNLPARIFLVDSESTSNCIVTNLSRGGACLHLDNISGLKSGDDILVSFQLKSWSEPLLLEANIRWIDIHNKVLGIEFDLVLEESDVA